VLLKYCAVPKITHLLRAVAPDNIVGAARRHDDMIMTSLSLLIDPRDPLKATANAERSPADIIESLEAACMHAACCVLCARCVLGPLEPGKKPCS
jgi:hypothetical protein